MILQGYTDQQIKFQAGWAQNSQQMLDIYGNFKDEDMVNSIYEKTGLKMKAEDIQLKATQCPRCNTVLMPGARVCHQCALILDAALNKEGEEAKDKAQELILKAMGTPEFMEKIKSIMEESAKKN